MRTQRCAIAALAAAALLTGCATPYQPNGFGGGYSDRKIDDNTYYVAYAGNGYTSRVQVFRAWIYRCAEMTTQNGYDYFVVLGPGERRSEAHEADSKAADAGDAYRQVKGAYVPVPIFVPSGRVTTYRVHATIRMYKGPTDTSQPAAFTAKEVLADLQAQVRDGQPAAAVPSGRNYDPDQIIARVRAQVTGDSGTTLAPSGASSVRIEDLQGILPAEK